MSSKPSVFIIDEDEAVLRWCEVALRSVGITVEIFTSGHDFLLAEWRESANCVVLDANCEFEERKVEVDLAGQGFDGADGDVSLAGDGSASDFPVYQRAARGLGVLAKVLRSAGTMPVVLLTEDGNGSKVREAFLAGAYDVLTKPLMESDFQRSITTAVARKNRCRMMEDGRPVDIEIRGRLDCLTPREFEVLGEMLRGMSIKQLAARFEISIQTAAKHRARVLHKMRSENEVQLIHLLGRRWEQVYADIVI